MAVAVRGASLAGMAAAARLARLGHDVTLVIAGSPLGQRWAPTTGAGEQVVDDMAQVIRLPATWRDTFKKSGGHLVAELNRAGLTLREAPPATHEFPDGSTLELPTERGAQFHVLNERYGNKAAERWRDLLDELDLAWRAQRRFGIESAERPNTRHQHRELWLTEPLANLADRVEEPHLAHLIQDLKYFAGTDSPRAPGLLATQLVIERSFGRWYLSDEHGAGQRASLLIDLLANRLEQRRVQFCDAASDPNLGPEPEIIALPYRPHWTRPALAPSITHWIADEPPVSTISEIVRHTATAPIITWQRPTPDGALSSEHDYRKATPDLAWGLEPSSARAWLRRPEITGQQLRASAASPAGGEPWGELSNAALAVYELHHRLTGQDCRPSNRDFQLPRL